MNMNVENLYNWAIWIAIIVWCAVIAAYYIQSRNYKNSLYGKQSNKSFFYIQFRNQGARGEYWTSRSLEKAPFEYKMLFNCYIQNHKGDKTELDIIMISSKGIYVVENKNYTGWIFGDENSRNWCETIKGKKYFFYNPVKQNKSHIKNLEKFLKLGEEKYISIISFNKGANLKKVKVESPNTYVVHYNKLEKFIKSQNQNPDCLTHDEIEEIYNKLLPGTQLTEEEKQAHIERINKEYKKAAENKKKSKNV